MPPGSQCAAFYEITKAFESCQHANKIIAPWESDKGLGCWNGTIIIKKNTQITPLTSALIRRNKKYIKIRCNGVILLSPITLKLR